VKTYFKSFWVISVILSIIFATACSADTSSDSDSDDGAREVNILYVGEPQFWLDQADEFEEATGIKVNYESIPFTQLHDAMFTSFSGGGSNYDVIHVRDDWAAEFASQGFLEPLDEYITDEMKEKFSPYAFEALSYKGKSYGIPRYMWLWQFYYNKEMLAQAGYDKAPKTWDELAEMAKTVQEKVEGVGGYAEPYGQNFAATPFIVHLRANGGEFWDYDKDAPTFNTSEGIKALQFMKDMNLQLKALSPLSFEFTGTGPMSDAFVQGRFAMNMNTPHTFPMSNDEKLSKVVGDIEVSLIPGASQKSAGYAETGGLAIPSSAENKDEAFEFIEFVTSFDQQKKMAIEAGRIPADKEALTDPEVLEAHPHFKTVAEQIEYPFGMFKHEKATEITNAVSRYITEAVTGDKTAEEALKEAEDAVLKIINR
jgi:multiple sugar transport system substrate-binding protein